MSDTLPTVQQLRADETLLRRVAGEVLEPGPNADQYCFWREGGRCYRKDPKRLPDGRSTKVCPDVCDNTDPATGSDAEIADQLVKKCNDAKLFDAICSFRIWQNKSLQKPELTAAAIWRWFGIYATAAERICCCLVAMGKARIE